MTQAATTQSKDAPEIHRVFQSKAETKAFYDKISHVYDLLAEHSEGPIRRAGLEKLDALPGEKVLEIGFGTGQAWCPWHSPLARPARCSASISRSECSTWPGTTCKRRGWPTGSN